MQAPGTQFSHEVKALARGSIEIPEHVHKKLLNVCQCHNFVISTSEAMRIDGHQSWHYSKRLGAILVPETRQQIYESNYVLNMHIPIRNKGPFRVVTCNIFAMNQENITSATCAVVFSNIFSRGVCFTGITMKSNVLTFCYRHHRNHRRPEADKSFRQLRQL